MVDWTNRGLVRGTLASVAGLAAMALYFKGLSALQGDGGNGSGAGAAADGSEGPLDDIAVVPPTRRDDEASTETIGRLAHQAITGEEPDDERKRLLGQAVHWGYGMLVGSLYGALREDGEHDYFDIPAGLGYGAALWLLGDEIAVPALGLAMGPTAHPASMHASMLGAHLVYGATTAAANRALSRVI